MLVYAIAVILFLSAAGVLLGAMHRALTAEDARYGARAVPPTAPEGSTAPHRVA